jgi:hypothetical protein
MVALLPNPVPQFCDADGNPYAGGTIATYVPGTTTPKATWLDSAQAALNTNPIVLDAAGRCIMYGDGEYRLILRDAVGNLVWDQPSSTLVSAAMAPVILAPTIADARNLLGIDDAINAEAAARAAADSAEQSARIAADNTLQANIDAETARAEAAEAALDTRVTALEGDTGPVSVLPAGYSMRFGTAVSDSGGNFSATFSPPFPNDCDSVVTTASTSFWAGVTGSSAGGFSGVTSSPLAGGGWESGPIGVHWIAIGHAPMKD